MIRVHRAALGAAALVLALGTAVVTAAPAAAHNVVVETTPAADAVLTELPESFSITTSEPWIELDEAQGFAIQIRDAAGLYYGDGCVDVDGATMSTTATLGLAGAYTVVWQGVSADGHTIDGRIPFTWEPSDTGFDPASATAEPPVCGVAAPTPTSQPTEPAAPEPTPSAVPEDASGIDLATVLWIGGVLLAVGAAVAVGIALAARRRPRARS